jgi:ammonia channel protein AmtB
MMILVLAFAAACTAGILYPLDWIIGIRLAKEDELAGLDLAGIMRSLNETINISVCFSSW